MTGLRRDEFPILHTSTYLCSHSLGAVPASAAEALATYHHEWATLGIRAWDGPWWAAVGAFGDSVAAIIGGAPGSVVPMQNVTRGMAAVASCFDYRGERNRVVMTDREFTTSYPFWRGQEELGAQVVVVPPEELLDAIDERTLLVPTSHVYFRSGEIADLAAVVKRAHEQGAYCLGDGYQAAGTVDFDVAAMDIDFYVGGSHKWLCGGPGAGFLYVKPGLAETLRPRLTGWFGLKNPFAYELGTDRPAPADGVMRFLGGTPNVPGLYAAREGIRIVSEVGLPAIRVAQRVLSERIVAGARERGFEVKTPLDPERRSGMVCLDFSGAEAATEVLVGRGIIVDYRPDCGLRVSPHFYNDVGDVEVFFEGLDSARV
ncbi:MAG: kynureninase [Myxococcota bacterium]